MNSPSAINTTLSEVSRLNVLQVFWEVDDFCRTFEQQCLGHPQLPSMTGEQLCQSRLSRSEVMTILMAFQGSGYRTYPSGRLRLQGVLQPLRLDGLATRIPESGERQPLCGADALVSDAALLPSLQADRRDDRHCLHRLDDHRGLSSSPRQVAQSVL
ncbi:MAG: hypothetical protein ACFB0E_07560 [Leptolyngbyaceae cyanobacterium]